MIVRDLYRCPPEDLHAAIAGSTEALLCRGVVVSGSAVTPDDVHYLATYPDFDPSLSFLAYESGAPVAFLVSRIEAGAEGPEAVWTLFGGLAGAQHAREVLLDDTIDHWKKEGAARARQGLTGLLGTRPRLAEDAELMALLAERGFEVEDEQLVLALGLKKLVKPQHLAERVDELRRKGFAIRPARPDDIPLIARQYHPRRTGEPGLELWNHIVRHLRPEALVVAEFRHQLVGYLAAHGAAAGAECVWLGPRFVDPVHRNTGLEAILLFELLGALKKAGAPQARLLVPKAQAPRHERLGFAVESRLCVQAAAELD